jgi:hypothetical protein
MNRKYWMFLAAVLSPCVFTGIVGAQDAPDATPPVVPAADVPAPSQAGKDAKKKAAADKKAAAKAKDSRSKKLA